MVPSRVALVLVLVGAGPAFGQIKMPASVDVPVGRLASIVVEVVGKTEYKVLGSDVDVFREYDADPSKVRLRVIGYKANTTAYVVVAGVKGDAPVMESCQVNVGKSPTPPPDVDPLPPPTVDPLETKIRAAYSQGFTAEEREDLKKLAGIYRAASTDVVPDKTYMTMEEVSGLVAKVAAEKVPLPRLKDARVLIASDLMEKLGEWKQPLTDEGRAAAVAQYVRVAKVLEALAR